MFSEVSLIRQMQSKWISRNRIPYEMDIKRGILYESYRIRILQRNIRLQKAIESMPESKESYFTRINTKKCG